MKHNLRTAVVVFLSLLGVAGCGGGGSGAAASSNLPRFAYVANYNDNTVSIYTVNAATGQLRHNGYVAAGTAPYSVTVDPSGKFAYAANYGSSNVSAYTINASTGALTPAVAAGSFPFSVTTTGTIQ